MLLTKKKKSQYLDYTLQVGELFPLKKRVNYHFHSYLNFKIGHHNKTTVKLELSIIYLKRQT